ncbi:hypothetical protein [Pseudomonas sp. GD03944]|uniref:hypothetical protein n=1 Tax=Pseudomonas sp. GD03944 TaxID=2975409 RepID=UPI00244704E3|nr:hypothetical protein [Pseudomonas sp. GD03944]MDH1263452.1 hypothetical protein [Pseudomonas sp. GD03944]
MTETTAPHPFAQRLQGSPESCLLRADQSTGAELLCIPEVEEQTQHYLVIEHGDSADRGMLTGALGGGLGFFSLAMGLMAYADRDMEWVLYCLLIALAAFILPFLWEVLRPIPLPILLNRRTRELYFEQDGELYHTPWDGIAAAAYSFATIGPYTAGMRHAALEALLHRYGHPQEQVVINLGSPISKSLDMQLGFWEYLRTYMDKGPWFDEQGNHSESDAFIQSLLEGRKSKGQWSRLHWGRLIEEYRENNGRNFLTFSRVMMLLCSLLLAPLNTLQNFTYTIAKRRARNQWPALVKERPRPNGPNSRLVDLEREQRLV